MVTNKGKKLAVIPARCGSKGLPDKNIKLLNDKHLMGYSIEAAAKAGIFDCIHVSTDSLEYKRIAESYGADVSFLRPETISGDDIDTWSTIRYVVNRFREMGHNFEKITVLQPTSPLRLPEDIINADRLFEMKDAQAIISVCETECSPALMNTLGRDLSMNKFIQFEKGIRRQDLETCYQLNGAIYMFDVSVLDDIQNLYGEKSFAYVMPRNRSVDIDTMFDFEFAEFLLNKKD